MQDGQASPFAHANGHTCPPAQPIKASKSPGEATTVVTFSTLDQFIAVSNLSDMSNSSNSSNSSNNNGNAHVSNGPGEENSRCGSSSSEEDGSDVVKTCWKLQRQRSFATHIYQHALYDYRIPVHSLYDAEIRKRKLILHVDIRNTILVADSVTNVSVEEALNSFLTAVVWGQDVDGAWAWYSDVPSLKSPAPGLKTYYKHLEKKMVTNLDSRARLRAKTGDFVHTYRGQRFQKHFHVHLARLAWTYPHKPMDKVLTMSGKDGRPYHYILPSFYRLLQYLTLKKRDFAVVLRTYGRDADNVLSSLHYGTRGNHPAFRAPLNLPVHKKPGVISRSRTEFSLRTFKSRNHSETLQLVTHERDIYRHFCSSKGISGFVDDFWAWQGQNYHHKWGKPFWIDPTDAQHHHIFFDDNFRSDDEDSIVDVRVFAPDNPGVAHSVNHKDMGRYENVCLVQADLLESIANESYFIRMVRMCEENYNRLLSSPDL